MSIRELVRSQAPMSINKWLAFIASNGLTKHERLILEWADYYDLIEES